MKAIDVSDKRVVNGIGDINQLAPFKYPWAWEYWLNGNKNHWTPLEVNMASDVMDYNHKLTPGEKHVFENVLAYLTTSDILAMRNIGLAVMEKITAPELQIYQARQVFDEALHCYIEGTEVLTDSGWIDFRSLKSHINVAQYNEDGTIEFVEPLGFTCDHFDGELIKFSSSVYESVVTANHRCVMFDKRDNNKLVIKKAEDFYPSNFDIPVAGKFVSKSVGAERKFTTMDKLRIAYQADGTLQNPDSNGMTGTGYRFSLKKLRKIDRLELILQELSIRYTMNIVTDGVTIINIPKNGLLLSKNFDWVDPYSINYDWARAFIDELTYWDGSRSSDSIGYSTTSESCYNFVSALGAMSGYRIGVSKSKTCADNDYWTVNFVDMSYVSGRSIEKTSFPYVGNVYSVGVPSTMLIVRYNDKITVSGNTWTYQHCIETLGLDQTEIYNRYRVVPAIRRKIDLSNRRLQFAMQSNLDLTDKHTLRQFAMSYLFFAAIFEGTWFYNGFTPVFALQRRGLMRGTGEQFQYIMRDEVMHASFGLRVVKTMLDEEELTLDLVEVAEMWSECYDAEHGYIQYILQTPILGYSVDLHMAQFKYIANRRMRQIGFPDPYPGSDDAIPWLDEQINTRKEKNFFETRVTEYQTGGSLNFDE